MVYFETILYITGEKFVLYQHNTLELKRMTSFFILNTSKLDNVLLRLTLNTNEYRGKFLTKLWCCVGGKYNKEIWFYQLG